MISLSHQWFLAFIVSVLVTCAGCGASSELTSAPPDVLRVTYFEDPETLNPLTSGDATGALFQSFVYEQLADRNMAEPDELIPRLAEKWEFDEERLEYTIHLRKGVQWQPVKLPQGETLPGREFTTRDVRFTFDCILNPHIPAGRGDFEDPEATDAAHRYRIQLQIVDDYTFKIRWTKPYFLSEESSLMIAIIPRHVFSVDEHGELISLDFSSKEFADGFNNHWAGRQMVGTGPLRFGEWRRNERVNLIRNENYWGTPFHFNRVVFTSEANSYALLQKLLQHQTDWADIDQKDLYLQSRDNPNVANGQVMLNTYDYPGYRYIGYNLRRPLLADPAVRRALAHAVPVQEIIQVVFNGLATQTTGPFAIRSKAYNQQVKPLAYDLDKARELLKQAGWRDTNRNGTVDKVINGDRVEARLNLFIETGSSQYSTVAQIIQNNWRQIGVRVAITPVQQALMTQRVRAKEFDAVLLGWALAWRADPFLTWHSSKADLPGSSNLVGYRNEQVDKLVTELRVTFDKQKQIEMYHQIHKLIYDDQPYTFLFSEKQTCGYSGRLGNVKFYDVAPCVDLREWTATE